MPIHIRLAETEQDIDQVFRVRHQVFCQEEDLIHANAADLVVDRFDAFPASKSFVSLDEAGRVVGSVRVTLDNAIGLPAEEYFDFRSYVPEGSRMMSISMFCVAKHHRSTTVARGLLLMCGYYAMANQMDYTCMPANPTIGNMICRIGGKPLLSDLKPLLGLVGTISSTTPYRPTNTSFSERANKSPAVANLVIVLT